MRSVLVYILLLTTITLSGCSSGRAALGTPLSGNQNGIAAKIQNQYQHWRGTPYRFGGNNRSGIDCSALVQRTYADQFGMNIPRTTAEQVKLGRQVSPAQHQAGDLVFFKTGANSRHVGVYIGNGEFLNASTSKGVIISRLDNVYWSKHYWQSRRLLN